MSYARQRSVFRFIVVVGTAHTVALGAKAATHANAGRPGDGNGMNCCVENMTKNENKSLRDAHYKMFTEAPLHEDHEWHPLHDRRGPPDHSHESKHMHNHDNAYDHKNDNDDDDYDSSDNKSDDEKDDKNADDEKDDKNDDDGRDDEKDDENDDDGRDDSKHNSLASSSSDQKDQSSVLTDLDGINIGNTITIVNIGTASQQPGNNGPSSEPNGNVLAPGDDGRAALISTARAFCDSVGCNSSQGLPSIDANSSSMNLPPTAFSVADSNVTRDNDVRCELAVSNGSSRVTVELVKWLFFVAIFCELLRF